ncbi:hypothetical protein HanPI659440_Chr08g0293741 [Helianthus annuus]|nr:hypothetical protein HanPI659440_Chr08g0293741 [Helianthus annuus]
MDQTAEQDQEHEVYGGDIPEDGEMDADMETPMNETEHDENTNSKELEDMKKRLKEIEEEAGALREMQAKVEKEMGSAQGLSSILVIFVLCITMLLLLLYFALF